MLKHELHRRPREAHISRNENNASVPFLFHDLLNNLRFPAARKSGPRKSSIRRRSYTHNHAQNKRVSRIFFFISPEFRFSGEFDAHFCGRSCSCTMQICAKRYLVAKDFELQFPGRSASAQLIALHSRARFTLG